MRNLRGFKFPHRASQKELAEIEALVLAEIRKARLPLAPFPIYSHADRDFLVSGRLISTDFRWQDPGRAVIFSSSRDIAVMVNEEDHLRFQAILGGWNLADAVFVIDSLLESLKGLPWARTEKHGYLAASPSNLGQGRRHSAMLHLIGLAHHKRLQKMMNALRDKGLVARGAFGESSRAIGAFVQISDTAGDLALFKGAVDVLISEERSARQSTPPEVVRELTEGGVNYIRSRNALTLSDALRSLAFVRWGAIAGEGPAAQDHRKIDTLLTKMELGELDPTAGSEQRVRNIRRELSL